MCNGLAPLFVNVTVCVLGVRPIAAPPMLTWSGYAARSPPATCPTPSALMRNAESPVIGTETVALLNPLVVGLNVTGIVSVWPASRCSGKLAGVVAPLVYVAPLLGPVTVGALGMSSARVAVSVTD